MTLSGSIKDLLKAGYSTEEIIQETKEISKRLEEKPKFITKETLNKLRESNQKEHYVSQAEPMFIDGIFNPDNWNGGDDIIRQYFSDFSHGVLFNDKFANEIDCYYDKYEFSGDIVVSHTYYDDQNYVTIVFHGSLYNDKNDKFEEIDDVAYFSWYKSRGTTEIAKYNGELMTEEQYLFILNALQATGYRFDLSV